jgi:hypothetical protein
LREIKSLTDQHRADPQKIDERILVGRRIAFGSTGVETGNGGLTVLGELELAV